MEFQRAALAASASSRDARLPRTTRAPEAVVGEGSLPLLQSLAITRGSLLRIGLVLPWRGFSWAVNPIFGPADMLGVGAALELYGSLGVVAGLFQTAYLVAAFGLSGLLLVRGLRERELPPILLGLNLLFAMGLGYVLLSIGVVATELGDGTPPPWVGPLIAGGYATTIAGLIAALVFTYRVFRPGQPLALAFVSITSFGMWLGWFITGQSGGFAHPSFRGTGITLLLACMLATNFWVASEPLAYYRSMRRRMRIGLAEPIVVERFLLWGQARWPVR